MKALVFERSVPKFARAKIAGLLKPGGGAVGGPLSLDENHTDPVISAAGWSDVYPLLAGICGSDLATVDGRSSRYFEKIVSFPFVLGHEVVGELADGSRVVVEPVLSCVSRQVTPVCRACARGDIGRCENIAFGAIAPGLQSGFCCDTGGAWSNHMLAHQSQLHAVPDELSDEDALMVEPTACAVHAALSPGDLTASVAVVIGAGTLGLATIAALSSLNRPEQLIVAAKHPEQKAFARTLAASSSGDTSWLNIVDPNTIRRAVRSAVGCMALGDGDIERLAGGADVVFDCVGTSDSITEALAVTRPGGRIVLVGMAGRTTLDLTPLWQREVSLCGAYAYGYESMLGKRTFDAAFEVVTSKRLGQLVSAKYPLERYEEAIAHAAHAGQRGAVKIAFDIRTKKKGKTHSQRLGEGNSNG